MSIKYSINPLISLLLFPFHIILTIFIDLFFIKLYLRNLPLFNLVYKLLLILYIKVQCIKYNSNISKVIFKSTHSYAGSMIYKLDLNLKKYIYIMQLSNIMIERGTFEEIDNIIKHEIAHQIDNDINNIIKKNIKHHNNEWRKIFLQIGGNGVIESNNYTRLDEYYHYICHNKLCSYYKKIAMYNIYKIKKRNCKYCGSLCSIIKN